MNLEKWASSRGLSTKSAVKVKKVGFCTSNWTFVCLHLVVLGTKELHPLLINTSIVNLRTLADFNSPESTAIP